AAQHSDSMYSTFVHFPGLKVVAPATPADAKGLLAAAIRDDDPVIFCENKMLYDVKGEVPEGEYVIPLGQPDVKRAGSDVTGGDTGTRLPARASAAGHRASHAGAVQPGARELLRAQARSGGGGGTVHGEARRGSLAAWPPS